MNKLFKKLQSAKNIGGSQTTYSHLFKFFIPLGTSTLLISISNMLLNRCLGYIPDSEIYISSLSVARTLMQLFMSPVSIIALTVTSFSENKETFKKVTRFSMAVALIMQAWFFMLGFSPIGAAIFVRLYNLDGSLLENAVLSLRNIVMLPSLFFIRDYFLAVAIKLRNVKFATFGSFLRTVLILICSFFMPGLSRIFGPQNLPGALLFAMVFLEAAVYSLGVVKLTKGHVLNHVVQSLKVQNMFNENAGVDYKKILVFALPLIFSYSMAQLLPSFTQSALALGQNKEIILAIYAVSLSFLNIIAAFSFQIPQLVVNHNIFDPGNNHIVRKFCFIIASFMTLLMIITAFTRIGQFISYDILKVSSQNVPIAGLALKYGLLYPASMVFMGYKRGKLIKIKKTGLLFFERFVGAAISLVLFLIIPVISWRYGAGAGILTLTVANFATGFFTDIIFRISVRRSPSLITHSS